MKLGTEKIEEIKESIKKLVIAGKKISADKKVDLNDLVHIMALLPELPAIISSLKEVGEAFEELKDVDVSEAIALIQSVHEAIKEIEKA
jgi:hypothetical protein